MHKANALGMTRQQLATVLYRYAQYRQIDVSTGEHAALSSFTDAGEISDHAVEAMQYAVGAGLLNGKAASTLNPTDHLTRAELAMVLQRFFM